MFRQSGDGYHNADKDAPCRSFVSSTGRIFVHCILMAVQYSIVRVCLIAISVLTDIFLGLVINHVLGLQLPFDYDMLLTPVVLTWYIATELGSILENAAEMGAPVPPVLREVLEKVHKASDRKDTTASAGHQDE